MSLPGRLRYALRVLDPAQLRIGFAGCPFCAFPVVVKLAASEHAVHCARCAATPLRMCVLNALLDRAPDPARLSIYDMSGTGPVRDYLRTRAGSLTTSEYLDGVAPGEWRDGVQCQDVQRLTFPDRVFDMCISTEVFEHVPDDRRGFDEIRRVLRPGGIFLLTVPLGSAPQTVERARLEHGRPVHLLPPRYHDDPLRGPGTALVYRDYGMDIVARLRSRGFTAVEIVQPERGAWWGYGRPVIAARRPA